MGAIEYIRIDDAAGAWASGGGPKLALHTEQIEAYRRMSPSRKLELVAQMWNAARELKAAYLRSLHPDWSEARVRARVRETFQHARG